ncbi:hypothetical protein SAMN04488527_11856 [Aliiroseovarius crassostreae]|uniref:DUF7742 domain-containing protein n=1 Tax=Aliiroseovarius crassostreae TaxID=154981 RepID=A0A0P7J2T3_9RHOB|nr:hypothetical protein [Aliiroseovarius crassostreae]KPN61976.1 hypothetical protein AKJ29_05055 [Aliiroseovarius crassostreae]SFU81285.1 hypothetical protein SAMN04488527_11856 [Aliiroseovarius crassostreae]
MRPVLPGDVAAAACALLALPAQDRPDAMLRMVARANMADRYRYVTGRAHPKWGNGSLAAVARKMPREQEPYQDDPDYCDCMLTIFAALRTQRYV